MRCKIKSLEPIITGTSGRIPKIMIISREPPELVEARLGLEVQDAIWVTHFLGADVVSPNNLAEIARRVKSFLSKNKNGVVILTDFGFLVENNDHGEIETFLHSVNDAVSGGNMLFVLKQTSFTFSGFDISNYCFIYLGEMIGGKWSVFGLRSMEHPMECGVDFEFMSFNSDASLF